LPLLQIIKLAFDTLKFNKFSPTHKRAALEKRVDSGNKLPKYTT